MTLWWQVILLKCSRRSMGKGGNPEDGPAIHGMWRTTIHAHEVVISQHIQSKHETPPDIRTASTSGTTVTHPVAKSKSIAPQLYSWTWRSLITGSLLDLCFKSNAPKRMAPSFEHEALADAGYIQNVAWNHSSVEPWMLTMSMTLHVAARMFAKHFGWPVIDVSTGGRKIWVRCVYDRW